MPAGAQPQLPAVAPTADDMDFDQHSSRTIPPENPWIEVLRSRRKNTASTSQRPATTAFNQPPGKPLTALRTDSPRNPPPRLPRDNYTIVYRPRSGLNVATSAPRNLTHGIATASNIPLQNFYDHVIVQVQNSHNLVVASTAHEEYALALSTIKAIQLGAAEYELMPYMKPPPDTSRGVIHGLDSDVTSDTLLKLLQANKPQLLHARLMGRTTSALLTFQGPHVPFYVKVGSLLYRCRPFRRTVQVCRLCGDIGHRQDVCPNPDHPKCPDCGLSDPPKDHTCSPNCKLCNLPHTTAGKECPKKLVPAHPVSKSRASSFGGTPPSTRADDPQQVSWSAIVSGTPTAHAYPPLPTRSPHPPPVTPTPQAPSAIEQLLAEIKQQNTTMLARIEALEAANRTSQQSPNEAPTPALATTCPHPLTPELATSLINEKITTEVLPMIAKHIADALLTINNTFKETTDSLLRLTESITQRLTALEQANQTTIHPQVKKAKLSPEYDADLAAHTPLPPDGH